MASACVAGSKSASCFICKKEKHQSNLYKVHGSRARDGNLFVKLGYFFDEELLRSVRKCCDVLQYCKTCETQINNCHKFIKVCHEVFTEVCCRKRTAPTPLDLELRVTPQNAASLKLRKLLKFGEEECRSSDEPHIEGVSALPSMPPMTITLPNRYKKLDPQSHEAVTIEETAKVISTFTNAGLYYRDLYVGKPNVTTQEMKELKDVLSKHQGSYDELVKELMEHDKVKNAIQKTLLMSLDKECTILCGKRAPSNLRTFADIDKLKDGTIGYKCLDEMENRLPFLLDVLVTIACGVNIPVPSMLGPVTMVYGILLKARCPHLSAYQRMITLVLAKYGITDRGLAVFAALGISLTSQTNLDECARKTSLRVQTHMATSELGKVISGSRDCDVPSIINIE
ncbi:uncharacterized protein LOC126822382 [Patella vulgata]|uniref:uncharacterized protein LOC126822382 n=1 Tax=Patella vulgata TaxID=6465 RepID=UPI00217F332C|nr:uncharacterized protein LOC126822382 [Patella vulgata]